MQIGNDFVPEKFLGIVGPEEVDVVEIVVVDAEIFEFGFQMTF